MLEYTTREQVGTSGSQYGLNGTTRVDIICTRWHIRIEKVNSIRAIRVADGCRMVVIHPVSVGPLPATVKGLIAAPLHWQALAIEAALEWSHHKVMAALIASPHAVPYRRLSKFADEMLRMNEKFLTKS